MKSFPVLSDNENACSLPINIFGQHVIEFFCILSVVDSDTFSSGTTAAVCLIRDSSEMVVANVGDSRAVLCRKGKAMRLSHDDDPDDPEEFLRVTKLGGKIVQNSQGISQVLPTMSDPEWEGVSIISTITYYIIRLTKLVSSDVDFWIREINVGLRPQFSYQQRTI